MSKLIVEMEMPKRCVKCVVRLGCMRYVYGLRDNAAENLKPLIGDKDCLIKGVLLDEHGDLIDRDALLRNEQDVCELCKWGYSGELIRKQQAIIAAERKHDESKTD